jgi:hypothetical protein
VHVQVRFRVMYCFYHSQEQFIVVALLQSFRLKPCHHSWSFFIVDMALCELDMFKHILYRISSSWIDVLYIHYLISSYIVALYDLIHGN